MADKMRVQAHGTQFCGPAALSVLTGQTVTACEDVLRKVSERLRDKKRITGTRGIEILHALNAMGFDVDERTLVPHQVAVRGMMKGPTFKQWRKDTAEKRKPDDLIFLGTGHHWFVLKGRTVWDNKYTEGVSVGKYGHARGRVEQAWIVRERAHPLLGQTVQYWRDGWYIGKLLKAGRGMATILHNQRGEIAVPTIDIRRV